MRGLHARHLLLHLLRLLRLRRAQNEVRLRLGAGVRGRLRQGHGHDGGLVGRLHCRVLLGGFADFIQGTTDGEDGTNDGPNDY